MLDGKYPTAPQSQHNKNLAGKSNFYNFNKGETIQESRSSR
jgi:hypothetical protein